MTRAEYDMGQPDGKKPEGCAIQMDTFADMIRSTARELENSIFTDERLEKKNRRSPEGKKESACSMRTFL